MLVSMKRARAAGTPWLVLAVLVSTAAADEASGGLGSFGDDDDSPQLSPSSTTLPLPPYMLQLYERYQNGDLKGSLQGNTVRSILATKGKLLGNEVLLFNLSGIHDAEQILRVELHFYQRGRKGRSTDGTSVGGRTRLRLHLLAAGADHPLRLGVADVDSYPAGGWHAHEVTEAVTALRKSRHSPILAARFESRTRKGPFRHVPTRKFTGPSSQPFLIVFSNDTNSLDVLADATNPLAENGSAREKEHPNRRRARSLHDNRINEDDFGDGEQRKLRSVLDNELPGRGRISNHVPLNNPSMLLPRPSSAPRSRPQRPRPTPALLPYPGRRRKPQKHRRKQLPTAWQKPLANHGRHVNDANLPEQHEEEARLERHTCKRRSLVVDFADIGWGEWIISPKSFEANYCAGTCPFPLTKSVRPSNHATIQSLVHAIGARTGVPPPCCVPDSTSSLTLLYFDDDRNVVLKNYPAMTVESCACR